MYTVLGVQMLLLLAKIFWNEMIKKVNEKKKQIDGRLFIVTVVTNED